MKAPSVLLCLALFAVALAASNAEVAPAPAPAATSRLDALLLIGPSAEDAPAHVVALLEELSDAELEALGGALGAGTGADAITGAQVVLAGWLDLLDDPAATAAARTELVAAIIDTLQPVLA